jgi:hypothetical protein
LVALLVVGAGVVAVIRSFAGGPVSRARVERFASRQRLTVTADNGNQVIRYLATSRRWRTAGLIGGLVASQVMASDEQIVTFNFIVIFAGWFLGALIAEARVAHLRYGVVRGASLTPRRPARYVRRFAWVLVPATAALALLTGVATAVADGLGWAAPDWSAWGWLAVAITLAVAVRVTQLVILRRPQPLAAADVIAADDAIRSRALHVLSGGGAALVLFVWLAQLAAAQPVSTAAAEVIGGVGLLAVFAAALLGWLVATSIWPPPGGARPTGEPATGAP